MRNLWIVFKGEVIRLFKYKILLFGSLVSLIWVIILALSQKNEAVALLPFLLVLDTGMMSIILMASSFYYEKQEGTIKTLLVAPVSVAQVLLAKMVASLISSVISMTLIGLIMLLVHGTVINYALAFLYVSVTTLAHVAIGYLLILKSKDFMGLLMKYMVLALVFMIPSLLFALDLIPESFRFLAFLSPTYSGQFLVDSLFIQQPVWEIFLALGVLILLSAILYPIFVYRQFKDYAVKG